MKLRQIVIISLLGLVLGAHGQAITVDELIRQSAKYDGKAVAVKGKVDHFLAKTSKRGNEYIVFRLKGETESASVFMRGKLAKPFKGGDAVIASGIFRKDKKMGDQAYQNEIDASPESGKDYGVKLAAGK